MTQAELLRYLVDVLEELIAAVDSGCVSPRQRIRR
jgi:hypothetical protein